MSEVTLLLWDSFESTYELLQALYYLVHSYCRFGKNSQELFTQSTANLVLPSVLDRCLMLFLLCTFRKETNPQVWISLYTPAVSIFHKLLPACAYIELGKLYQQTIPKSIPGFHLPNKKWRERKQQYKQACKLLEVHFPCSYHYAQALGFLARCYSRMFLHGKSFYCYVRQNQLCFEFFPSLANFRFHFENYRQSFVHLMTKNPRCNLLSECTL